MKDEKDKTGLLKDKLKAGEKPKDQPTHMKHYANERESIIRQTCLKAAAQMMTGHMHNLTPTDRCDMAIRVAEKFEAWVNRTPDETADSKD